MFDHHLIRNVTIVTWTGKDFGMIIRNACADDCTSMIDIYNYYIAHTIITFEEQPVNEKEMAVRIRQVQEARLVWLAGEIDGVVIGYAYATPFRPRSAYRHTVESTIYLDRAYTGKGLGSQLYQTLLARLRESPIAEVIGVLALPNEPSVRLHEKLGFKQAGLLRHVGYKFGQWIDTGYWQLSLGQE